MGLLSSGFPARVKIDVLRVQGGGLTRFSGYSEKAQCTGKPSYLKPNSQSMQKIVEGVYRIGVLRGQWHVGNAARVYLDRIRNSMHEPIEGLFAHCRGALNKGAIEKNRTTVRSTLRTIKRG